jgi:hypothetical protein
VGRWRQYRGWSPIAAVALGLALDDAHVLEADR